MSNNQNLLTSLRSLLGMVEIAPETQLHHDTLAVCSYLEQPTYRLAVFAPFNHGKSTLLNALLGSKTLPIDLIPTTGAGIIVEYGAELATEIILYNGEKIRQLGTKLLAEYAVLDGDRQMRADVAEVRVSCNHPWLKTGVELLDLPGTNDRQAQNDLVRDKLLGADLVIQVLDARKLMTLEERQHLTQWLQQRGIERVVFVVNFLNLLAADEQQEVRQRACYIAESFRSDLPAGISNLYCVDALPALRARLKGNLPAAQETGLTTLESALQTIVSHQQGDRQLARVFKVGEALLEQARIKRQQLASSLPSQQISPQQIEVRQKAAALIRQSFERYLSDLRGWLYLPKLLTNYQPQLAISLQKSEFDLWLTEFEQDVEAQQQTVNKWIVKGSDFFAHARPQLLEIALPAPPVIQFTETIATDELPNTTVEPNTVRADRELNSILKSKVGSVILGGASYVLNKVAPQPSGGRSFQVEKTAKISSQAYIDAAAEYLQAFSDRANQQLDEYAAIASQYLTYTPPRDWQTEVVDDYQIQLLDGLITKLQTELANVRN